MEKYLLDKFLGRMKYGVLKVTYWDGSSVNYGDGIPTVHIVIKKRSVARAILRNVSLGFGEGYMNGLIDIDGPLEEINRLTSENSQAFNSFQRTRFTSLRAKNRRGNQQKHISYHYDLGNDFYKLWLDASMTYSCAYFRKATDSLETAQQQKVDHTLKKLQLEKGMKLLDIGSGWGTLLITAAKKYGVSGLGVTLSDQQYKHSVAAAKKAGVDHLISFELTNYQDLAERDVHFDRIVSVGMFEHVGRKNQQDYFKAVSDMLEPGGISVLHTITNQVETTADPWIDKYIFPGGYIPATRQVVHELPRYDFRLTDYENLRIHYAMTLEEWLRRFEMHKKTVLGMYDERFYRMWKLYLASSAGTFRYGDLSLSQFVFTKGINNNLPLTREFLYKPDRAGTKKVHQGR